MSNPTTTMQHSDKPSIGSNKLSLESASHLKKDKDSQCSILSCSPSLVPVTTVSGVDNRAVFATLFNQFATSEENGRIRLKDYDLDFISPWVTRETSVTVDGVLKHGHLIKWNAVDWGSTTEAAEQGKTFVSCGEAHKKEIQMPDDSETPVEVVYTATLSCSPSRAPRSIPSQPNPLDHQCLTELGLPHAFSNDVRGLWSVNWNKEIVHHTRQTWISTPKSCPLGKGNLSILNDPSSFSHVARLPRPGYICTAKQDADNGALSHVATRIDAIGEQTLCFASPRLGRDLPPEWVNAKLYQRESDLYSFDFPVGVHESSTTDSILPGMAFINVSRKFNVKKDAD